VIAASGILVIVAFVTLIVGVFNTGLGLIWTSIAASILAAIFLALGVMQGNRRRVVPAGGPAVSTASTWTEAPAATTAVMERAPAPAMDEPEEEPRPSLAAVPAAEESSFAPAEEKPAAKPRTRAAAASAPNVVVVPDRDKFHKETCRYAKNPAAMTMTKAAARRQGYKPCGVCKP
jgi:hypothetical protein